MNARSLSGINDVTSNGDVALTMNARSMSGINDTFGGGGDVFLAGNPNTFTGTNTFNTNRPTSTLATTPGSNDFITKSDGESLFGGGGDVTLAGANTFTGTNIFNTNRPTSTLATAPGSNDFITKSDGEGLFTNNTGDVTLAGANTFTGTNIFNTNRPTSNLATAPGSTDFITKSDGEGLFTNNTGDALLDGGTEASPQTFTEFNKFDNSTTFNRIDIGVQAGTQNNTVLKMTAKDNNLIEQQQTQVTSYQGNEIYQHGGTVNKIFQKATGTYFNHIEQEGTNSLIETAGIVQIGAAPTLPSPMVLKCRGGIYLDGASGIRIPRRNLYDNPGLREWWINQAISGGAGANALNYLYSVNAGSGGTGVFVVKHRLNANGAGQWANSIQGFINFSDDRLKTNEAYLENATESLLKLSVQTYNKEKVNNFSLLERTDIKVRETGLIAQEVYYNAPEFRHLINCGTEYDDDEYPEGKEIIPDEMDLSGVPIGEDPDYEGAGWSKTEMASVEYQGFIAYLIKSNQELHERISILEVKINNM